jgi:hypothetical protein
MARISAVLSSRSPGQKNVNRFSFGDICPSVWIGVDSKKAQTTRWSSGYYLPQQGRTLLIRFAPIVPYAGMSRYGNARFVHSLPGYCDWRSS